MKGRFGEYVKPKRRVIIMASACAVTAFIISLLFDIHYDTNDDTAIRDILSGAYTGIPDGHCIQLLYPLGMVIAFLYRCLPAVHWFGLFLSLFLWAGIFMAAGAIIDSLSKKGALKDKFLDVLAFLVPVMIVLLFFRETVLIQYTFVAGLMMAAAVARLYSGKFDTLVMVMTIVSFCLRSEMMLLLCPFLIIAFIKYKSDGRVKEFICKAAVLAVLMGIVLAADHAAYSSPDWKEFRRLFDARTQLYDYYGIPEYGSNKEFYDSIGISEEEHELLVNYNTDISDNINETALKTIASYAASNRPLSPARTLYEAVYAYIYRIVHGQQALYDIIVISSYIFIIRGLLKKKKTDALVLSGSILFALRSSLWIFLLYRGRVPERITHPLYMTELSILALMLICLYADKGNRIEKYWISGFFLIVIICGGITNYSMLKNDYNVINKKNIEWESIRQYCRDNPEELFYFDVYSTVPYTEKIYGDPVSSKDGDFRNFEISGGWIVKSPLSIKRYPANKYINGFKFIYNPEVTPNTGFLDRFFEKSHRRIPDSDIIKTIKPFVVEKISFDN